MTHRDEYLVGVESLYRLSLKIKNFCIIIVELNVVGNKMSICANRDAIVSNCVNFFRRRNLRKQHLKIYYI